MTTVRHKDLRVLGYCNAGARRWFSMRGLDWHALVMEGIPASVLEPFAGDELVDRVLENAREREAREARP